MRFQIFLPTLLARQFYSVTLTEEAVKTKTNCKHPSFLRSLLYATQAIRTDQSPQERAQANAHQVPVEPVLNLKPTSPTRQFKPAANSVQARCLILGRI